MDARVVSVNRGAVGPLMMPGGMNASAIDKRAVDGPVAVTKLGIAGDEHRHTRVHGGPTKAVHLYASEDLAFWSAQLGVPMPPGFIGENITTGGIDLGALYPDDVLHIGAVVLRVTLARDPCTILAARLGHGADFVAQFGRRLRTGVYTAVEREGFVQSGDSISIIPGARTGASIAAATAKKFGVDLPVSSASTE